jgi:hypothetical protein
VSQKGTLNSAQKARLVDSLNDEIDELQAQNARRMEELARQGLGVSPISMLAAQVEVLIHWTAPSEYARARFDRDVQLAMANALDEGNVETARQQLSKVQAEQERQRAAMEAAAKGRRESGLYVPESAAGGVPVPGATRLAAVDPGATNIPTNTTLRPPGE